jgi:metallo-beta-lactamase family protein
MAKIKLTSFGACEEVTGSCHLLEIDNFKLLIDCGLFQGQWQNYLKNWDALGFKAKEIDAVILTHAHLDHCGRLPLLTQQGFKGKIYATAPTIKIAEIILADNQEILSYKATKNNLPTLYSKGDITKLQNLWRATEYYKNIKLADDISFKFYNAAHILGAAIVELKIADQTIVFSGDIGGEDMPLVKNIDYLEKADYLILESTYGNRKHEMINTREEKLLNAVKNITLNHSTLIISIFAVERCQNVLKVLNDYYESHLDFKVPVFLDSPMAATATKIYKQHLNLLNTEAQDTLKHDPDIFYFPHLKVTHNIRQSKKINHLAPPKIILAGSGMAEGGRLIHHLAHYINNAKNNILFMGFQVPGTLGHKITHGSFDFDYYSKKIPIKAVVDQIDGFSAHADQTALLKWAGGFKNKPKHILLTHGDKDVIAEFSDIIQAQLDISTQIMKNRETVVLYDH